VSDDPNVSKTFDLVVSPRPEATGPRGQLAVVHPTELARRIPLGRDAVVFGRDPGQTAGKLPQKTVSRRHFEIRWDARAGTHVAIDLKSHNGSWLDGAELGESALALRDGSVLRAGSLVAIYELLEPSLEGGAELLDAIPGSSPRAMRLRREIALTAPDPSPVLVTGATGVGKEHVVRALHHHSGRTGPLVSVNVTELSPQLIESQLFGHAKGAFSGADAAHPGLFRHANGGTLFMDEIGDLPLELQPKLLRVIQQREVRPVGATRAEPVDVRVVAATNRNLRDEVERGAFRRDLWARLSLLQLTVPTLGERRGDLLDWMQRLHREFCAKRGRDTPPPTLDGRAVEALLRMEWPDNLRGLDRLVHRLALLTNAGASDADPVTPALLAELWEATEARTPPREAAARVTPNVDRRPAPTSAEELGEVLARFEGNVRATARWYGRDRRQVYRWMRAFGLERDSSG
jgi:transcriptional regulator with GAF, ATPase, and Fis domain